MSEEEGAGIDETRNELSVESPDCSERFLSCEKDDDNDDSNTTPPLSKSQLKKQMKRKRWEEMKGSKRKKEKEKKKARKQALKDAGIIVVKKKIVSMAHPDASAVRVSLDLSFNHLMSEKDRKKVIKQVLWSYSANRHSSHPLQLHLTNFDEENQLLFQQFSPGYKSWDIHVSEESHLQKFQKEEIVYLSSESENVLKELDVKKVYIIGALVDHNSQKGLCFRLAEEAGVSHARLPIDEYVKLEGRKILPINHVFEILLHFVQYSDWEKAFYSIIPKRKGVRSLQESEEKPNGDCQVSEPLSENIPDDMKIGKDGEHNNLKNDSRPNPSEPLISDGLNLLQQDKGVVVRDGS